VAEKEWVVGNKRIIYERRSKDGFGRFGGGWQWAVGFEASEGFKSIVINFLFFQVMVYPRGELGGHH